MTSKKNAFPVGRFVNVEKVRMNRDGTVDVLVKEKDLRSAKNGKKKTKPNRKRKRTTKANGKRCSNRKPNAASHMLEGWAAIAYAEKHGGTLRKYADPTERALARVSIEKAKRVAREDPKLIYLRTKAIRTARKTNRKQVTARKRR